MRAQTSYIEIMSGEAEGDARLRGDWIIDHAQDLLDALGKVSVHDIARIDATTMGRIDIWGAMHLQSLLEKSGAQVALTEKQQKIFDFLPRSSDPVQQAEKKSGMGAFFEGIGQHASVMGQTIYGVVSFVGEIAVCFLKNLLRPRSFRFHSIVRHIDETGFRALPIVMLLAVLISMVISYQAATQLQKFGANIFTVDLTVISLLREMGVLITAIMVAGRSGSAFAAEIGVMKLREEIDALRTMGFNPIELLVMPRLIALVITLPVLTFLADITGLVGSGIIATLLLDIPLDQYINRVESVAKPMMFFVGMIKAPVFAFVITIIGTYQGMNVSGSAESVGRLTTVAVVQSIFLVIMIDAMFSIIFANLGI